jgi:fructose-specific phosphotransferase system IIA component
VIFKKELIEINVETDNKRDCLEKMVKQLLEHNVINDENAFFDSVWEREKSMSTGIGYGIAIPHGRSDAATKLSVSVFHLKNAIEFDSLDDNPVRLLFMVAVPTSLASEYMKILSAISKFLYKPNMIQKLLDISSVDEIYEILQGVQYENQ